MAPFAFDPLDEEEKKKAEQEQTGGAPAMTGGGETFGAGSTTPVAGQEKGTNRQGSGFVGLDKYMAANKGSNFGSQVTDQVRGTVEGAKQGLGQSADAFQQASNQGAVKWGDVQNDVKGIVDNAGDATTQDDASKVKGYAGAKYRGPENFTDSAFGSQATGGVQKAGQQAKALQSEGGRFALLDEFYGRPKYSMGEKSLDNLLVQNQPGVAARAQSISGQAKQLEGDLGKTSQDMGNLAASNRAATEATSQGTRDYLTNARSAFESDLSKRYQDFTKGNDDYNAARRADMSDTALDDDTLGLTGLAEGSNLYDLNLQNYLKDSENPALGQFANDQDYAKYLALQQLSGEDPTLLSADDRAQAGTGADKGRVTLDKDRLTSDLVGAGQRWEGSRASLNATMFPNMSSDEQAQLSPEQAISNLQAKQDQYQWMVDNPPPGHSPSPDAVNTLNQIKQGIQQYQNLINGRRTVRKAGS
jgi:hypothetical protein